MTPGGVPHFKRYDRSLIAYYQRQMELLHVDVRFNTTVSAEDISSYQADVVIVATGSTPRNMQFEGTQTSYPAKDVLLGKVNVGNNVLVVGGGLVGCETVL